MTELLRVTRDLIETTVFRNVRLEHNTGQILVNDAPLGTRLDNVIVLGGFRQRKMLTPFGEPNSGKLECYSLDGIKGKPTAAFPWDKSNYEDREATELACGACIFATWSSPTGLARKSTPARCPEAISVPMLVPSVLDPATYALGLATLSKSAYKPVLEYMKSFSESNRPAYSVFTTFSGQVNLGKDFRYAKPAFERGEDVPERAWATMSTILAHARELIMAPPKPPARKTGGMLSVSLEEPAVGVHTGSFFG